jgi:hypothetical protein
MQEMVKGIQSFLYQWRFAPDGLYRQLNPHNQPFSAPTHEALIALLRVSVPAIGRTRAARVSDAIRLAGYEVIKDQDGVYIKRNVNQGSSATQTNV